MSEEKEFKEDAWGCFLNTGKTPSDLKEDNEKQNRMSKELMKQAWGKK